MPAKAGAAAVPRTAPAPSSLGFRTNDTQSASPLPLSDTLRQGVPPTPAPAQPGLPSEVEGSVQPDPSASSFGTTSPLMRTGTTNRQVIASAQQQLANLGLYRGDINGQLTGPTRAALRLFQQQGSLAPTGELDSRTARSLGLGADQVRALAALQATPARNLDLSIIVAAQTALRDRGFFEQRTTGALDEATILALRSFQTRSGLAATGTIDFFTAQALGLDLANESLLPIIPPVPSTQFAPAPIPTPSPGAARPGVPPRQSFTPDELTPSPGEIFVQP